MKLLITFLVYTLGFSLAQAQTSSNLKKKIESQSEKIFNEFQKSTPKILPDPDKLRSRGGSDGVKAHKIEGGGNTMPYYFVQKGKQRDGDRSLFIQMHGGGGNPSASGPHAWDVNTNDWNNQLNLVANQYRSKGLYFIPRMADDRQGRWWYTHNQIIFQKVVTDAVLHHGVNPNKVYLMGISEGGYGTCRLGAFWPDKFAGLGAMAAAEPVHTSPPENLCNVAFTNEIGEHDTGFDRIGMARRYEEALKKLKKEYPHLFSFNLGVQRGRGHGIDYTPCPKWLEKHTRNPSPKEIIWTVQDLHGQWNKQNYWICLEKLGYTAPLKIHAKITKQNFDVSIQKYEENLSYGILRLYVDPELIDIKRPISVVINGNEPILMEAKPSVEVMKESLAERGDIEFCYPAVLEIDLEQFAQED